MVQLKKVCSQNSSFLITPYVEFSNRNGLFSSAHLNVHGVRKFYRNIMSLASKSAMTGIILIVFFSLHCIDLVTESI